jgi:hypothetical protein
VCRFHIATGAKQSLDEAPYKLFIAITKLASITFWSLDFSYWTDKPWFLTEGNLLLCSSNLPLFFERKCGRGSPYSDFGFLKIRTQIRVCVDLNLGGWVVHPLP